MLAPLHGRFVELKIASPEFSKECQKTEIREEVHSLLNLLSGVIQGASGATMDIIFSVFARVCLPSKPDGVVTAEELLAVANGAGFEGEEGSVLALIKHYAKQSDILVAVLELFKSVGTSLLPIVSSVRCV